MKKYSKYSLGLSLESFKFLSLILCLQPYSNLIEDVKQIIDSINKNLKKTFTKEELLELFPDKTKFKYKVIKGRLDSSDLSNFEIHVIEHNYQIKSYISICLQRGYLFLKLKEDFIKDIDDEVLQSYKDQVIYVYKKELIPEEYNKTEI